ncbi:MAG: thiol-disulfide oxidoreductase DCC family protein [Flavobacteriaceae bacterium]|jgi:predicted DCC family thiol-disulfide oxidoreductase YuxK|tara:strand:+ start:4903 stop:5286 length:384 start_codon:yes stop_codon:yes gene_type:complete
MIVFFDGVCNLCQGSVRYLIKHDKKGVLKFASLQGNYAKDFVNETEIQSMQSIMFFDGKMLYKKSTAVLKLSRLLGGWHQLLLLGYILPRFVRDWLYNIVAKNRYRWFGKKDQCMLPSKGFENRFLD